MTTAKPGATHEMKTGGCRGRLSHLHVVGGPCAGFLAEFSARAASVHDRLELRLADSFRRT